MEERANTKSLLTRWKESKQKQGHSRRITKAPEDARIPASSGQKRLWFLHQLYPENPVYNYSEWYHFKGKIDVEVLKESIQQLHRTHNILRTYFQFDGDVLCQHIDPFKEIGIREHDLSTLPQKEKEGRKNALLMADAGRHFDLDRPPLVRVILLKLSALEWILMVTMHHIITDKWSMGIYRDRLAQTYRQILKDRNYSAETPEIQFSDYAYWEQSRDLDSDQLGYWKKKLSGEIPELKLPVDRNPSLPSTFKGDRCIRHLGQGLSKKLIALASELETTPYVLMLAAYYLMLQRYSGQHDILIGTPVSNRQEKALEDMIGFFDETLVLRTQLDPQQSFASWVQKVKGTTLEAFANKDISFDVLVRELKAERSVGVNPFFRTMFIYHAVPPTPIFDADVELAYSYLNSGVTKFDLTLFIGNDHDDLLASFEYSTDLFEEATIERFHAHYKILLEGIVQDPGLALQEYPMQTEVERQLFTPNTHAEPHLYSSFKGIDAVIEETATQNPEGIALVYDTDSLTYAELIAAANTIASHILKETGGENTIVGLAVDRSLDMIIGMLGILKAGCAYLPLDVEYPRERLDYMIGDAGAAVILVNDSSRHHFQSSDHKIINVSVLHTSSSEAKAIRPDRHPDHLAYIIYTSGSTGQPKGVPISHANILASTAGRFSFYPENPAAFLLMSSISFDSSKAGIFWTLCAGGTLVIAPKRIEQEPEKLLQTIREQHITHSLMLPSLYQVLLEFGSADDFRPLSTMIVAGEACTPALVNAHFEVQPEVALYNEYGPTEGTVWCTAYRIRAEDNRYSIPIGKAVAGAQTWILDESLRPVPFGVTGQLYISGPGLSSGYLGRPELNRKAFVHATLGKIELRLYATGDLVRFRWDGNLEFKGRIDEQIKIRGYRVELEAIEHALMDVSGCTEAKVIWDETQKILRAALVSDRDINIPLIREALLKRLPSYMIPAQLRQLEKLPLLPNGKVNPSALGDALRQLSDQAAAKNDAPENEIQEILQSIWQEVLQRDPIGVGENFFEIGGDSISSIQIIAKSRARGLSVEPSQIFEHQTIAELSLFVKQEIRKEQNSEDWDGPLPLSPIQHWFFDTFRSAPHYWNQIVTLDSDRPMRFEQLKKGIEALVRYHEGLRLAFKEADGAWMAHVLPEDEISCCFLIENTNDTDIDTLLREHQESYALENGNLFRMFYVNDDQEHRPKIFLIAHHLVVDMVSWNSIFDDLRQALMQSGTDPKLRFKPKTDSLRRYADFIRSQAEKLNRQEVAFWEAQLACDLQLPVDNMNVKRPFREKHVSHTILDIEEPGLADTINKANMAYNTNTEDLLLAALFLTLHPYAPDNSVPLYLERHGRAIEDNQTDFTNTIGWFTSFFPLCLSSSDTTDTTAVVRNIKEQLRQIPQNGIGYGILKYLRQEPALRSKDHLLPQVVFNYLGQATTEQKEADIRFGFLGRSHRHPSSERQYCLEINAFATHSGLQIRITYDSLSFKESTINTLSSGLNSNIHLIIQHCVASDRTGYTPSDFPEAQISQDDLDNLMEQLR